MPHPPIVLINQCALRDLRDTADGDYIAARMAYRRELFPQFFWLAQQALEKYLKCILLLHRKKIPRSHELETLLKHADEVFGQPLQLDSRSRGYLHEFDYGAGVRYGEVSWDVDRDIRPEFDLCVWQIRRYCRPVSKFVNGEEIDVKADVLEAVERSKRQKRVEFRLDGGKLEAVIDDRKSRCRADLLWRNACFGLRQVRECVDPERCFLMSNTSAFVWPEMLPAVQPYGMYREFQIAPPT